MDYSSWLNKSLWYKKLSSGWFTLKFKKYILARHIYTLSDLSIVSLIVIIFVFVINFIHSTSYTIVCWQEKEHPGKVVYHKLWTWNRPWNISQWTQGIETDMSIHETVKFSTTGMFIFFWKVHFRFFYVNINF